MERRDILKFSLLVGTAGFVGSSALLLPSCKPNERGKLHFFDQKEFQFLSEFSDFLLPRTATPGALDAQVPEYIDQIVHNIYNEKEQSDIKEKIVFINKHAQISFSKDFVDLSMEEKTKVFTDLDAKLGSYGRQFWGQTVEHMNKITPFQELKSLVIFSYFSSEKIAKEVLDYSPVPGEFLACKDLEPTDRVSAL